jgi:hypothetical protein
VVNPETRDVPRQSKARVTHQQFETTTGTSHTFLDLDDDGLRRGQLQMVLNPSGHVETAGWFVHPGAQRQGVVGRLVRTAIAKLGLSPDQVREATKDLRMSDEGRAARDAILAGIEGRKLKAPARFPKRNAGPRPGGMAGVLADLHEAFSDESRTPTTPVPEHFKLMLDHVPNGAPGISITRQSTLMGRSFTFHERDSRGVARGVLGVSVNDDGKIADGGFWIRQNARRTGLRLASFTRPSRNSMGPSLASRHAALVRPTRRELR